jgi:putative ABC transport system permease protein
MLDALRQDLLSALRNLRQQSSYTIIILFILALTIGGTTAVFSVVNAVLIQSLPYRSPEQLMMIWNRYGKMKMPRAHNSTPDFLDRKRESRTLQNMAAIEETSVNLIGKGDPERIRAARVSASLFKTLGVTPQYGRDFLQEEDQPGKNSVVIITHNLWKRQFGSDPKLIGKNLNLNGIQHTVVGIMSARFWYPNPETELWIPIAFTAEQMSDQFRGNEYLSMIGRARAGVSRDQVQAEMNHIAANSIGRVPDRRNFLVNAGWGALVVSLGESIIGEVKPALLVSMGAVLLLLLIGSANVANLILARAGSREKEIAIRAALGADRITIIRLIFFESFLLAIVGGVIGLLMAYGITSVLPAIAPEKLPRVAEISIDRSVLFFTMIVSGFTGVFIGIVPAFRMSGIAPFQSLKLEGTSTAPKSIHRFRNILVMTEIALALMLATGAALLARSFHHLISVNPGFQTENRLTFTLSLPATQYSEDQRIVTFYRDLLQQIDNLPGVLAAGANASLPIAGENWTATFMIDGVPLRPGEPLPGFEYRMVTPNYFRAIGIPLLSGRDFNIHDIDRSPRVVVIDETLANRFWNNQNPIGKRIGFANSRGKVRWREVVGVVGHVKNAGLKDAGREQIYFPHAQLPQQTMSIVIHSTNDPAQLVSLIRNRVKSLDPNLPIYQISTLNQIVSGSIAQPRFNLLLFALFAAIALSLAAAGIYGVLSYSVIQRRKEIGIRMALGARPQAVLAMIVRQSMMIALSGMLAGIAASMVMSRFLQSLLFQTPPVDPAVYGGAAFFAMFVALIASTFPAKRAARLDPLQILHPE